MSKQQLDFVIQALRSCPKEVVGKLAEQITVIASDDLDRLIKEPLDILGEMDLKASVLAKKSTKIKVKGQRVKSIISEKNETKAIHNNDNYEKALIEDNNVEHDLLKETLLLEMELNDLKENLSLVEIKMEKDDNVEMEPKSIQNDNDNEVNDEKVKNDHMEHGPNILMGVKEIKVKDPEETSNLVETKRKVKCRKKIDLESSDDERVEYNHKFPNINPRY